MASTNDGNSEDCHTGTEDSSKKSVSPWEILQSEQVAGEGKPPAVPPSSSAAAKPPLIAGNTSSVYVRADGKKVRRVKRHVRRTSGSSVGSSIGSSVTSGDEETAGSRSTMGSSGSVYIRADGKKVRRVKRKHKKIKGKVVDRDIPTHITTPKAGDAPAFFTSEDDENDDGVLSIDAEAVSTKPESADKQETKVSEKELDEGEQADDSAVLKSEETKSKTPDKSSLTIINATTSPRNKSVLATAKRFLDTFPGGSETPSKSIDSDDPCLVEPNDAVKEEETSQVKPQEKGNEKEEEEQTRMPISPAEEFVAKVEETNKSIIPDKEPSVEHKMDSFEEFVTLVESEEIPKKQETTVQQSEKEDEDVDSPQTASAVTHDNDTSAEQKTSSFEEFVESIIHEEASIVEHKMDSFEEFVSLVESEEIPKKQETAVEQSKTDDEDVGSPQTASAVRHDDDISVEQHANSFEEFVEQVESEEVSKIEQRKEPLEDFVMVEKKEDLGSPQSAHAVIVDVHVTSVTRDPVAAIKDTTDSRASQIDKNASERPPLDSNLMLQDASSQVRRSTVDPIQTSASNASEHANLVAYPSTEAVSPKGIEEDTASELEGGRLWFAAMRKANESSQPAPSTPNRRRLPETLVERTRSRADVDAFVTPRTPITPKGSAYKSGALVRLNEDDDLNLAQTAFAHKRVRVVQLLIFGLIGVAFGFFGSFYVQSSCHFLTATVVVGGNAEEFKLHYGMWKYTPLSSAFDGHSYCYSYDRHFTTDSPIIPRIVGISALLLGAYALSVLWVYLVLGRTDFDHWKRAIYAAGVSFVLQALTLVFFAGSVCQRNSCSVGPGAAVSILSTLSWFLLAFEMHYNTPIMMAEEQDDGISSPDGIVASLEMSDVENGVTALIRRVTYARGEDLPTLNQYTSRREKVDSPTRGSYKPPPVHFGETV